MPSPRLAEMPVTDRLEWRVRLELIPVGHRGDIVLAFEIAGLLSADLLPFNAQIGIEIDRIGDMPTV